MSVPAGSHPTKAVNRKVPQDRRPSVSQMLNNALSLQAANINQKAMLDMMATKLILILKIVKPVGVAHAKKGPLFEIGKIASMTRDECSEIRSSGLLVYPDEEIQAIITRASNEIAELLLKTTTKVDE